MERVNSYNPGAHTGQSIEGEKHWLSTNFTLYQQPKFLYFKKFFTPDCIIIMHFVMNGTGEHYKSTQNSWYSLWYGISGN